MTSPRSHQRRAEAAAEMQIFDALPSAIREAIKAAPISVRASTVRDALVRGVSEERVIETLKRSQSK